MTRFFLSGSEIITMTHVCFERTRRFLKEDLNLGDFYTTRHSNMSQVHAIFHLATNEKPPHSNLNGSFSSSPTSSNRNLKQSDLSSRHPVILGLRNILKACITNSIHTLTLPLLLTHEMNEVKLLIN